MAAAAGKKELVSLSLVMEVNILDVEEGLIHHVLALLGGRVEASRSLKIKTGERTSGAVMCETRYLDIKLPR